MTNTSVVMAELGARLLGDPSKAEKVDAIYKIVVEGAPGSSWIFRCKSPLSVYESQDQADCTLIVGAEDLLALASGQLNPQVAFMKGKIRLSGDISLAMEFGQLIFSSQGK